MCRRRLNLSEIPAETSSYLEATHRSTFFKAQVSGDVRVGQIKGGGLNQVAAQIGAKAEMVSKLIFEAGAVFPNENTHVQSTLPAASELHGSGNGTKKRIVPKQ